MVWVGIATFGLLSAVMWVQFVVVRYRLKTATTDFERSGYRGDGWFLLGFAVLTAALSITAGLLGP